MSRYKPTVQGSTIVQGNSSKAVDGNYSTDWLFKSVTHTSNSNSQNWWRVDLLKEVPIRTIKIWNRSDCCNYRHMSLDIYLSNKPSMGDKFWNMRDPQNTYDSHPEFSTFGSKTMKQFEVAP